MHERAEDSISLADLYLAYRKAKAEAFHEDAASSAIPFAEYEVDLHQNLANLLKTLRTSGWAQDVSFLGGYSYAPKKVTASGNGETEQLFYRAIHPHEEWRRQFDRSGGKRGAAEFRLVIAPSVSFQIISALWIIKVGHQFDEKLSDEVSYGNRLRRIRGASGKRELNKDCVGLFVPYFSAYRAWREHGLDCMRRALHEGKRILAITMDLKHFYHRVNPRFILRKSFLTAIDIRLTPSQKIFTRTFLEALLAWYKSTPDFETTPDCGIPVGLSVSKIISNVLLHEFDGAIASKLRPLYYGRYVDDVFLVLAGNDSFSSAAGVVTHLAEKLRPLARIDQKQTGLRLNLRYAADSDLLFAGDKQKIFNLEGEHGLDLITQIAGQIREQSSEHRMIPMLPADDVHMATRALLATPDATLQADALRKADAVSIRRLGLSLLLRSIEQYARDLSASSWKKRRQHFYGLVHRHLLSPTGFFDYFRYIGRVFGLMIACKDFAEAREFIRRLQRLIDLLRQTTTAGSKDKKKFDACCLTYAQMLLGVAVQASTVARFSISPQFAGVLRLLKKLSPAATIPTSVAELTSLSRLLLFSDFGRRPYKDYWMNHTDDEVGPAVPRDTAVKRVLRLAGIRRFRQTAQLWRPHWPALTFPTRPLSIPEIVFVAPDLLRSPIRLQGAIRALRGARTNRQEHLGFVSDPDLAVLDIPVRSAERPRIAVTNVETTQRQWERAANGRADTSLVRYENFATLLNRILTESKRPDYVVLPECSVPLRWALGFSGWLSRAGISLIAGVEYRRAPKSKRKQLRNDALVSLSTRWGWYRANIPFMQAKLAPAHDEARELKRVAQTSLFEPSGGAASLPIYAHGEFCFGVLLCSDLTDISNRQHFRGNVDALVVIEWNPDVRTFNSLVESAASDVHAFIVQVNNRTYGDSRVTAPYKLEYRRDLVRVKGGKADYYAIAEIDFGSLRAYQRRRVPPKKGEFKPSPIGFQMSARRRTQ